MRQRLLAPTAPIQAQWAEQARWAALCATQEEVGENLEVMKVMPEERTPEHVVEQTVELAESGEAGSSWFGKKDTTSTASTAVAKSVGEAGFSESQTTVSRQNRHS